jgi:hypothetical protein
MADKECPAATREQELHLANMNAGFPRCFPEPMISFVQFLAVLTWGGPPGQLNQCRSTAAWAAGQTWSGNF